MKTRLITVYLSAMFLLFFLIETIDGADELNFLYGLASISISFMCAAFTFHDIDLRDARRKIKERAEIDIELMEAFGHIAENFGKEMDDLSKKL